MRDKAVLVTGASRGIGRATAYAFAAAGARVGVTYLEQRHEAEAVGARCRELGAPDAVVAPLDAGDDESLRACADVMVDRLGGLDVLVNNAGVISWRPFLEQTFADLDAQVSVNLLGVMKLTRCLLPRVRDAVITVGSTATLHRSHTPPPYCATKWGVRGFVQALALEHPERRFVSVHPTVTATRMNDMQGMSPERVAEVIVAVARGDIVVEPGGDVDMREYAD